ncbi:hypothetical protein Syun_007780 [Stephania yunnanensis]|uniref:Uncharacterized protein n=1 Tax=Stephania yunnanensis TaxID=152371 RepID=A0AAP0Q0K1_9MAGN
MDHLDTLQSRAEDQRSTTLGFQSRKGRAEKHTSRLHRASVRVIMSAIISSDLRTKYNVRSVPIR